MQGANRSEGYRVWAASGTANRGQEESSFDDGQRDLALPKLAQQAQIEAAGTAGRVRKAEVEGDQSLAIRLLISEHGFSLRFSVCCAP
jgi:hypothetical protein